jgi:septum formation protein
MALATRLARAKAAAVALQHPDAWVIGSDQVAVRTGPLGELLLGKPGSETRCIEQLQACSLHRIVPDGGRPGPAQRACRARVLDTTQVVFRRLDQQTIARYVALEMPLDCAGGFKSEGSESLCESIDSADPSA